MLPRAILFDFNGVLIDDEPLHHVAFRRLLEEIGEPLPLERYLAEFLGRSDRAGLEAVYRRRGEEPERATLARLLARKASYYREILREGGMPWVPGAVELVRAAAASGRALGVVSGALGVEVAEALAAAGIAGHFKVLVTAEDVERGKPDPQGYRRALARLNARPPLPERPFHPHQVLALEDSPAGLAAASAAGLVTAGVGDGEYAPDLSGADIRLPGLAGLTVERLAELFAGAKPGGVPAGLS